MVFIIIQGISTVIVLVRAEMGLTYGVDNKISKTGVDFASSTPTTTPSHPRSSDK